MKQHEKGSGVERLVDMVKEIGHNTDVIVSRGEVVSEMPLTIYLSRFDLEVTGDDLAVNPDLMAHEEDVEVVLAGEVQSMTIYHPNQLVVGADVMVVSDVDGGANYVHSRLVQLTD